MKRQYSVVLTPDIEEGGYVAEVPALEGCVTQGQDVSDALANAREAIQLWIEAAAKAGEDVPEETEAPIVATVAVDIGATVEVR